jgi:hypothetical protein
MMDEEQRRPDAAADEPRMDEPQHDAPAQDASRPEELPADAAERGVASDDATTASPPGEEFETAPSGVNQEQANGPGPVEPPADVDEPAAEPIAPDEPWRGEVPWPAEAERPADAGPEGEPPPGEAEAYVAAPAGPAEPAPASTPAHSVPATPIGESTLCPRCGTENRPGVAFCRSCGQRLLAPGVPTAVERPGAPEGTQACPRCGTHNRAGVAFCQNCGANLRAPAAAEEAPGSAVAGGPPSATVAPERVAAGAGRVGAILGPVVMLIGAVGISVAWLLPFPFGADSLWARSFGAPGGYGVTFWSGYSAVSGGLADRAYFGFAAPAPILVLLLVALAVGGLLRASPGSLQRAGLAVALVWSIGLGLLFILVEVGGAWGGDLVAMAKTLTPGGIIFLLASLIVILGTLTRFARS